MSSNSPTASAFRRIIRKFISATPARRTISKCSSLTGANCATENALRSWTFPARRLGSPVALNVFGNLDAGREPRVRDRLARAEFYGKQSGPNRKIVIRLVVKRRPAPYFRGGFLDRKLQNRGRLQFFFRWAADLPPARRHHVLADGLERRRFVLRVVDHLRGSERHHGAVVDRRMKAGARQHQRIHD